MEQTKGRSMGWYGGTCKGQKYGVVCWDRQRREVWGGMLEQVKERSMGWYAGTGQHKTN